MGKYSKKKKKKTGGILLVLVPVLLLAALIWFATRGNAPWADQTGATDPALTDTAPAATGEWETLPEVTEPPSIDLPEGLRICSVSSYAGIYMEDGSGEVVSDVLMLVLENTGDRDLQLARISMEYPSFTAEFEVTNLPAGEKAVVLEKNRQPGPGVAYLSVQTRNVVFFSEAMSLEEDRIRITGANGSLEVENISGEDIPGDIYIYYKHSASDLLYGGITYRVSVKGGLAAGEKTRIIAGHYTVDSCRILLVDCGD
jgi:hypothetical protein